ncbi:MAG: hypothetical protein COC09_04575 [Gammaproteobacteria bacterium]|nr:MAG: hypothetical protein COC09_04575 [Gammaproteobacteria bacterium]
MLSCQQVAQLTSRAQSENLSLLQRLKIKFHLMVCKGCQHYCHQINWLHQATTKLLGKPSNQTKLSNEARDRIEQCLKSSQSKQSTD